MKAVRGSAIDFAPSSRYILIGLVVSLRIQMMVKEDREHKKIANTSGVDGCLLED